MGCPMAASHLTLSDLEGSKFRFTHVFNGLTSVPCTYSCQLYMYKKMYLILIFVRHQAVCWWMGFSAALWCFMFMTELSMLKYNVIPPDLITWAELIFCSVDFYCLQYISWGHNTCLDICSAGIRAYRHAYTLTWCISIRTCLKELPLCKN